MQNIVDIIYLEAHRLLRMGDSALQKSYKNVQYIGLWQLPVHKPRLNRKLAETA